VDAGGYRAIHRCWPHPPGHHKVFFGLGRCAAPSIQHCRWLQVSRGCHPCAVGNGQVEELEGTSPQHISGFRGFIHHPRPHKCASQRFRLRAQERYAISQFRRSHLLRLRQREVPRSDSWSCAVCSGASQQRRSHKC